MKDEDAIEREIQSKGLNAPRLTPTRIDAVIASEQYHVFPGTTLTVCALTLRNGFNVTGESAAASPENFDEEIGRKIARENARNKIWALEGYLLKQWLHEGAGDYVAASEIGF
ncbi:Gp49 family protein [Ensifer adhaerens]|uniref:Gp49 family protein n=1 Tax=Ensifer adhaerens TaxID=106592 RepID=UPI0023A9F44E|nr:Gp49 family protein [Ensifer adhaerens]WDZ77937.1 Gp49 family protein [Ensifer adhaerens]